MGIVRGAIPRVGPPPPPARGPPNPKQHLGCRFGVPSIAHNDTGYDDQSYWRGRSWCVLPPPLLLLLLHVLLVLLLLLAAAAVLPPAWTAQAMTLECALRVART